MKKLLLSMMLALAVQTTQVYAEDNYQSAVQSVDFDQFDVENLARAKSNFKYGLPDVGGSLVSNAFYAITASGNLVEGRAIRLTVLAKYNKKGLYKVNISNADSLLPAFSHDFLLSRSGVNYFGPRLDNVSFTLSMQLVNNTLAATYYYIDSTTGELASTYVTFQAN